MDALEHPGYALDVPGVVPVFLDTEFTDIHAEADLISIGMVSQDAKLYIELTDWDRAKASDFVLETVIPLLGGHAPERLTRDQAAIRITRWLSELRGGDLSRSIVLLADSSWDWRLLAELWSRAEAWPTTNKVLERLISDELYNARQRRIFDEELEAYFVRCQKRHHALVDAIAAKVAFEKARG